MISLTLDVLAIVNIIFIEFDDLTHFKKIHFIIHLWIKLDSLAKWDHYGNKFITCRVYILCLVRTLLHSSQ